MKRISEEIKELQQDGTDDFTQIGLNNPYEKYLDSGNEGDNK